MPIEQPAPSYSEYARQPQQVPEQVAPAQWKPSYVDLFWAFVVWGVSGGFGIVLDLATRAWYWRTHGKPIELQLTPILVIISLVLTMMMHAAGLVAAWLVVTKVGKRPFWRTLGWGWHPRFKWFHAVGLAFMMLGLAFLLEKLLPHKETDMERILKLGLSVRIMVALLAVLTAPLIEEVVYRGVIFSSVEGLWGGRAAIVVSTLIFALVHVPQYWGSWAANAAILSLSLALTLLRYRTGSLLPCVATHLVYNAIQAALLLVAPEKALEQNQTQPALVTNIQWLGPWLGL